MTDPEIVELLYLLHQELWNWTMENHRAQPFWPEWDKYGDLATNLSFACSFDPRTLPSKTGNNSCLLDWPIFEESDKPSGKCSSQMKNLLVLWYNAPKHKRKEYARMIRDLDLSEHARRVLLGQASLPNKNLRRRKTK